MNSCIYTKLFNINVINASTTYTTYKSITKEASIIYNFHTHFPVSKSSNIISSIACKLTIASN